ncbi:hypothetical protein NC652_028806 [Populus alba x Populus x berolinensis]|nr:hypothetical protein NC652_028806 [Populus alba x Populus x berolinensis]
MGNPHKPQFPSNELALNVLNCVPPGTGPSSWLCERFMTARNVRSANCTGILPVSKFEDKSNDSRSVNIPNDDGIWPAIIASNLLKYPFGKGPLKLLLEMSKIHNLEKELLAVGPFTKPWSLLDFRTRIYSSGSFPKHCGIKPLKLLLDKSRIRRNLSLQIEEEISPVNLLLDARTRASRPNNERTLLTLDEGKEPVRLSLYVKSSTSRFGRRKMLSGNLPCNPQPQRARADKDDDRFAKELERSIETNSVSCPRSSGIEPVRLFFVRSNCWRCLNFLIEDGNSPCNPQEKSLSDDKEEDIFIKELGATNDMFTHLSSSSLSWVRFRTSLSKENERASETNSVSCSRSYGIGPVRLLSARSNCWRCLNFLIEDGNSPCNPQEWSMSDDREEDRFIKESGVTNDMSTELRSSSLSWVRFRASLAKEIGSRLR